MRKTTFFCDKCKKEIVGGVAYSLTCYAETLTAAASASSEVVIQNERQNNAVQQRSVDLCKACKDELTDGLFIV